MARPRSRIRPNLFELPDPLLDKLLAHVDDQALVELGATCRRFNTKALATFFGRHNIINPRNGMLLIYEQPPMTLKAFRRSMFVHDLREIHYYFHPNTEKLFVDVYDMTQLVERLTHVSREVRFHFSVFDRWISCGGSHGHMVDPTVWKRAMSTLLDKVLDKGCKELYVTGAAEFSTLYLGNPALGGRDPSRTLTPTVSPMPAVPQPYNDLPIAVASITENLNNVSIQDSKPPMPSQEMITARPRGLFSIFRKKNQKTPAAIQLTTRFETLDGADTPQLAPPPPIGLTTPPGSALTSSALSRIQLSTLDGMGDDPIPIKPITRPEGALTPPALSSIHHSKQIDVKGGKDDIYYGRKMTLFHIHSKMLLDDPFLDWTVSAIMASAPTLTTLSFECSSVHTDVWHSVLRSLYLPHLQNFALMASFLVTTVPGANYQDLHYFLERHPTIKILNLYGLSQAGSPFTPLTAPILPNLVDLKAHPYYITWILSPIKLYPMSMPGLTSITIGSEYLHPGFFRYADFDDAIRSVADIGRKVKLCIRFAGQPRCDIHFWLQSHINMHTPPSPIVSLHHIQDLVISSFFFADLPAPVLYLLPTWLNLFPSLRSLQFHEVPPEADQLIDDLDFKQMLADGCPRMERMVDCRGVGVSLGELRGRSRGMEDGSGDSGLGWRMGDPTADGSG